MSPNKPEYLLKVKQKVKELIEVHRKEREIAEEILGSSTLFVKDGSCPLDGESELSHEDLVEIVEGAGCYQYTCPFCGKIYG